MYISYRIESQEDLKCNRLGGSYSTVEKDSEVPDGKVSDKVNEREMRRVLKERACFAAFATPSLR